MKRKLEREGVEEKESNRRSRREGVEEKEGIIMVVIKSSGFLLVMFFLIEGIIGKGKEW